MSRFTQKISTRFLSIAIRVVTLTLFLVIFGASAALAQTKGYATNFGDNSVSAIDTVTNTVIATIPVGPNRALPVLLQKMEPINCRRLLEPLSCRCGKLMVQVTMMTPTGPKK